MTHRTVGQEGRTAAAAAAAAAAAPHGDRDVTVTEFELPFLSKFLLLAAFIASRVPASLDADIFETGACRLAAAGYWAGRLAAADYWPSCRSCRHEAKAGPEDHQGCSRC